MLGRLFGTVALGLMVTTAGAGQWAEYEQLHRITSPDSYCSDFGRSVSISGDRCIVGTITDRARAAYVYDVNTAEEVRRITRPHWTVGYFGWSVALSGNTAVIGALNSAFAYDISTGQQLAQFLPTGHSGSFGEHVAVSGNIAMVGAEHDDERADDAGAAYLFDIATGARIAKLTAPDAEAHDRFGCSVAVSGNFAIVGSKFDDDGGMNVGSAYVFDASTGDFLTKLTPSGAGGYFGSAVAMSGSTAVVTAPREWVQPGSGTDRGTAYVFDLTSGELVSKFLNLDGSAFDHFGCSAAIDGGAAIVGAHGSGYISRGHAHLFDVPTGDCITRYAPDWHPRDDRFGAAVGISGDVAIVGAPQRGDGDCPSVYLFTVPELIVLDVDIDIALTEDGEVKRINLDSQGVLPVMLLGSDEFDVSEIDPRTLELAGAAPRTNGRGRAGSLEDVNDDSLLDLVLRFPIGDMEIAPDATELTLVGKLEDGTRFEGADSISIICNPRGGEQAAAAVPEPACALLILLAIPVMRRRTRRERFR